jgi:hypothetical protein
VYVLRFISTSIITFWVGVSAAEILSIGTKFLSTMLSLPQVLAPAHRRPHNPTLLGLVLSL